MVIETSADVCVCHLLNPRELKIPSKDSALEKTPARREPVLFRHADNLLDASQHAVQE